MLRIVTRLLTNLFITLSFEVPLSYCFGVREKRKLATVALINCATNPIVNFTLAMIPFFELWKYSLSILLFLELLSVVIEGFVYKAIGIKRAFLISLILNFASYFGGQLLHRMI